jgi:hypothetical protein
MQRIFVKEDTNLPDFKILKNKIKSPDYCTTTGFNR